MYDGCCCVADLFGCMVRERIGMEMVKIEQVIVGSDMRTGSAEIKSEPVIPLQCCKLTFICIVHT